MKLNIPHKSSCITLAERGVEYIKLKCFFNAKELPKAQRAQRLLRTRMGIIARAQRSLRTRMGIIDDYAMIASDRGSDLT